MIIKMFMIMMIMMMMGIKMIMMMIEMMMTVTLMMIEMMMTVTLMMMLRKLCLLRANCHQLLNVNASQDNPHQLLINIIIIKTMFKMLIVMMKMEKR